MVKEDEPMLRLIAVGSAVVVNCATCLEANLAKAREYGADENELARAIWIGQQVRQWPAEKMDGIASRLVKSILDANNSSHENCACDI